MARAAAPPTVDLVKIGGDVWHVPASLEHVLDSTADAIALCGRRGTCTDHESDVDARVTRHHGADVCADCQQRVGEFVGATIEEGSMSTTTTDKPSRSTRATRKRREVKTPIKRAELDRAIKRAEKAAVDQPTRAERELTKVQNERAFVLGKKIGADLWFLRKRAKAGETNAATIAMLVDRVEANVAARNKIRRAQ